MKDAELLDGKKILLLLGVKLLFEGLLNTDKKSAAIVELLVLFVFDTKESIADAVPNGSKVESDINEAVTGTVCFVAEYDGGGANNVFGLANCTGGSIVDRSVLPDSSRDGLSNPNKSTFVSLPASVLLCPVLLEESARAVIAAFAFSGDNEPHLYKSKIRITSKAWSLI